MLRRAAAQQRVWMSGGAAAAAASPPAAADEVPAAAAVRAPSWVQVVTHFTELEASVNIRLERLYSTHREVFAPKFGGEADESEDDLQARVEKMSAEVQKFLGELQRLLETGVRVRDEQNYDEQRAAQNVRKHLSSRLGALLNSFRHAQESYADQLRKRDEKKRQFRIGDADVHERLEKEERVSQYLEQGYSQVEINELLMMEDQAVNQSREVQNIVASINELNSMFTDLRDLVVEQGTVLDRIDYNIDQASVKVEKGLVELKKAREQQKKCLVV